VYLGAKRRYINTLPFLSFLTLTTAVQVVRFVAGSLDLGYVYDDGDPPSTKAASRRARWVARTSQTSDSGGVTLQLEEDARCEDPVQAEQGTQTDEQPEQLDAGVQTESAARSFSSVRKDLPQFARPAKHFVK